MIGNSFFTLVDIAKKIFILEKKLIYLRRPVFYEIVCFWEREKSFGLRISIFFYRLKLNPENPVSCIPSDPE